MNGLLRSHLAHLRRRNARAATIRDRRGTLLRLHEWLGADLASATAEDLQRWQDSLRVGTTSQLTYTSHVRSFYLWAHENELLEHNPAARMVLPRKNRTLPRPVPEEHLELALRTATGHLVPILVLAAYVGLRVSEIAAIRREDVIRDPSGTFLLVHGKGGKERIVPLVGDVMRDLAPWLAGARGQVFQTVTGLPAQGHWVTREVTMHMRGLGLPYTAHQLRHRFGTRLYRATQDLRLVQEVMGHASADQTAGYVQLGQETAAAGMRLLAGELSGGGRKGRRRKPPAESAAPAA